MWLSETADFINVYRGPYQIPTRFPFGEVEGNLGYLVNSFGKTPTTRVIPPPDSQIPNVWEVGRYGCVLIAFHFQRIGGAEPHLLHRAEHLRIHGANS